MSLTVLAARGALLALCLGAVAGCGRRGPLENPPGTPTLAAPPASSGSARRSSAGISPDAGAPPATTLATQQGALVQDTPDDEAPENDTLVPTVNPSPTPGKRRRPYAVPHQSFVLDPLL
jgi:predicted small lipoprotein YifL